MIVRIFRVGINKGLKEAFENDFNQISIPLVKARAALKAIKGAKTIAQLVGLSLF